MGREGAPERFDREPSEISPLASPEASGPLVRDLDAASAGSPDFVEALRQAGGQNEAANAWVAEQARRRLALLDQVSNLFVSSLDREITADQFVRILVPNYADWCALYLREGEGLRQGVRRCQVENGEATQVTSHTPAPRRLARRFRSGKAEVFSGLVRDEVLTMLGDRSVLAVAEPVSAIFVPMVQRGESRGGIVLLAGSPRPAFDLGDLTFAVEITRRAGLGFENIRLYDDTRRSAQRLQLLIDVAQSASQTREPDDALDSIVRRVGQALVADYCHVRLQQPDGSLPVRAIWARNHWIAQRHRRVVLPIEGSLGGRVVREGNVLSSPDGHNHPELSRALANLVPPGSWIHLAPIPGRSGPIGVLSACGSWRRRPYASDDAATLSAVAQQAAIAIENAQLYDDLRRRNDRLRAALDETRAAQEQLVHSERMRVVGELTSGVAHDFNNLLAAILGRVEVVLTRPNLPDEARQDLDVVEHIALDGAETVRRLQDLGRPRSRRALVPVDLAQIGRDSLEITRSRWREEPRSRGIRIEVHDELGEIPLIDGHAAELREMLTNLILNAVDAMPRGGRLTLRTSADDEHVTIDVEDTGCGITEEVRARIFEPFFSTKGSDGTGLGLAVVYSIVQRHDGRIHLQSTPGVGTCFRVSFPFSAAQPGSLSTPPPRLARRVGRILVVDDNEIIAQNLSHLLQNAGHDVVTASDGSEALETFATQRFDLVLTDLGLPSLNGFALSEEIRRQRPETPVILITGWGSQIDPQQARQHGVSEVLVKPFRGEDVENLIQAFLGDPAPRRPTTPRRSPLATDPTPVRKVLVVDDDSRLGAMVQRMVDGTGIDLEWVATPSAAFSALERAGFDVVLTDLRLVTGDGWEVVDRVSQRWPSLAVGVVTGSTEELDPQALRQRGVDVVVGKPFRRGDLLAAIEQAIENHLSRVAEASPPTAAPFTLRSEE